MNYKCTLGAYIALCFGSLFALILGASVLALFHQAFIILDGLK